MTIVRVIVDSVTRALDRPFDYEVPPGLAGHVHVGSPVLVPFGPQQAVGYAVGFAETSRFKLKPLFAVLGEPFFDEDALRVAEWIAFEYLSTIADALRLFLPPGGAPRVERRLEVSGPASGRGLRAEVYAAVAGGQTRVADLRRTFGERLDAAAGSLVAAGALTRTYGLARPDVGPVDDRWAALVRTPVAGELRANATMQRAVVDALSQGPVAAAELSAQLGAVGGALRRLAALGVVSVERHRRQRRPAGAIRQAPRPARLSGAQTAALAAIAAARPGDVVLIDGVTGSGKTEVYLQAIERVLAEGASAVVLVPEIALTPQTVGRFRSRFGDAVAVLHSRLSAGERYDQWQLAATGEARVVIGPRSALFAPLPGLALVIIDEEHEPSYKQSSSPRYHAREAAERLCAARGAVLVLGSATPSMEARAACDVGRWTRVRLPQRVSGAMPSIEVVDMAAEFSDGHRSMFSRPLLDALAQVEAARDKAVVFLNRRGFASFLLCRSCGFVPECDQCSVSLTYHETGSRLACHHCGAVSPVPAACPSCGGPYLRLFGAGTQRVEAELAAAFPSLPVVRMDADTTRGKGGHERLLAQFEAMETGVLLGTQMIAKGLDYPEVTLVGVISADTTLHLPDFRAAERTYQLLEQVAGRAGRGAGAGRVIVQTYWPQHAAIRAVAARDPDILYAEEREDRSQLHYPPYGRLANVLVTGTVERDVRQVAVDTGVLLRDRAAGGFEILGPSPAPLSRVKGSWRWHLLVKCPLDAALPAFLRDVLWGAATCDGVTRAIDVDPVDVL